MRLRRPLLAVLVALAVFGAACAGDSDDDTAPTTTGGDAVGDVTEATDSELVEENQGALAGAECPVDALDGAAGPVDITMWHSMNAALGETLTALAEEYNASQDRVRVELVNQNTYGETFDAYRIASGADRPNVVQLEETATQSMIDSETALPVQACAEAAGYSFDDHIDRVVRAFTVGDVLWPMPFNTSNPVLYYDAASFREAGLDPDQPPATLEELRAAAQALVDSGAATGGLAFDLAPGSVGWMLEQILAKADQPFVDNGNGRDALATEVLLDTPEALEIITFFRDLEADGLAVNTGANPGGDANFFAFLAAEPVGMTLNTSAALSSVLAQLPIVAPNLELRTAPLPGLRSPDAGGALVGGAALWIVADQPPEELAAAWDWVSWLNEPEQQVTWHLGTGYLPIRRSSVDAAEVQAAWEEQPAFRTPYDQLVAGNETVASAGPVIGPHAEIRDQIVLGLEAILLEGADPAAVLSEVQATANELLADYARRTGR